MSVNRSKRRKRVANYRQLADVHVPRARKTRKQTCCTDQRLYAVDLLEKDTVNNRGRVHYQGYSSRYDEWKSLDELELLEEDEGDNCDSLGELGLQSFSLYRDLAWRIKAALSGHRKQSPCV